MGEASAWPAFFDGGLHTHTHTHRTESSSAIRLASGVSTISAPRSRLGWLAGAGPAAVPVSPMGAERCVQEPLPQCRGNGSCSQVQNPNSRKSPRIMAYARSTSWQVNGNAMHSLLYPVCNEREAMRRQGLKPKDHAKENVRRIQELQRLKTQVLTADGCVWRRVCRVCGRVLAAVCE